MKLTSTLKNVVLACALAGTAATTSAQDVSGTLPVIYVNTESGEKPTTKEYYLDATYYIDPMSTDFEAVGTAEAPLPTGIKARGNYTWTGFDKKPYKLKLDKKAGLLGMKKNKHYALLAHADDTKAFLRNTLGFELSRRLGMPWTPSQQPVEFVFNGEYQGLYFLTETIRVDENRVNIVEQADEATDAEEITGGWLVEIDNYDTDPHITITEGGNNDNYPIWFTYKTPEILSAQQEAYLTEQMSTINDLIYAEDKTDASALEAMVDFDMLARFYIIQELMDNRESFHGSCYINREKGEGNKWMFGPVWDFGSTFFTSKSNDISHSDFHQVWIGELLKFPSFMAKVKEVWADFCANHYEGLDTFVDNFINEIETAAEYDVRRWPEYGNDNLQQRKQETMELFNNYVSRIGNWYGATPVVPVDVYIRGEINNWSTQNKMEKRADGTYIAFMPSLSKTFKIASEDWKTIDYGAPEGAADLVQEVPYKLQAVGGNISMAAECSNVNVIFDPASETLLVTDFAGINDATTAMSPITVTGNTVVANVALDIYTPDGRLINSLAEGSSTTLDHGIYIARSVAGSVTKFTVR